MKSMRNILFLFIITLFVPACFDEKATIIDGAWKTKDVGSITLKPYTMLFDGEKLIMENDTVVPIDIKKKDDVILIYRAGDTTSPVYTILVKDKDVIQIDGGFVKGTHDYYRTTVQDVIDIRHTKVTRPIPKDPF